jgi:peptidoglycan/LPS O-acetylase OafA/YrhL
MSYHFWFANLSFSAPLASLVDLFFVLSGFVLMPSLSVSRASKIDFLKKRFIRFYSVLAPAIIAVVLLNYINLGRGPSPVNVHSAIQIAGAFLLLQVFYTNSVWVLIPLWSLSAELFVNLLAVIFFPRRQRVLLFICLGLLLFVFGIFYAHNHDKQWRTYVEFSAAGRSIVGFYFGLWIRKLFNENGLRWFFDKRGVKWLFIALVLIAMWVLIIYSPYFFILAALPYALLVFLIASINESNLSLVVLKISKYLGRISFQMYLWHPFVFNLNIGGFFARQLVDVPTVPRHLLSGTTSVAITILLCEIAIRFFEKPLLNIGKRFL